jgi:hypothetical protein
MINKNINVHKIVFLFDKFTPIISENPKEMLKKKGGFPKPFEG